MFVLWTADIGTIGYSYLVASIKRLLVASDSSRRSILFHTSI